MRAVLGLDTSCYMTSVACVSEQGDLLCEKRRLLAVPAEARGLRQSEAAFQHMRQLPILIEEMAAELPALEWAAVCASARPRPADDSYMPVFQVGMGYGRGMAALFRIPHYETSHQQGHVRAARVDTGLDPSKPLLVFHLSGGTTELLAARDGGLSCVCATGDLHAGQLVDRIGVALGLGFPAGPALENLAVQAEERALVPVSIRGSACHLSGAERQLMDLIGQLPKEQIAIEVYSFLCRTIQRMIAQGVEETGIADVLLAGGVASSALLRRMLVRRVSARQRGTALHFARPELAGDNAVGVAMLGAEQLRSACGALPHTPPRDLSLGSLPGVGE